MSVTNEPQVSEEAVARALRATRANDAAAAPARHPRQTAQCPSVARFAAVLRRSPDHAAQPQWTAEEARHTRGCSFCQSMFQMFNAAAAEAAAAAAHEDTVTGLDPSNETHTGLTLTDGKRPAPAPKPTPPRAGE